MQQGDRVRIAHHDVSFYERLHGYNHLTWTPRMANYIGKVGIVKDATKESVQVTFYSWGPADAISCMKDGKSSMEASRNRVVEATYSWHPKIVISAHSLHMLDGDRAIMIKNKDLSKAMMVSIRVVDEQTYALRLPHADPLVWKQSDNPNDVILPIYSGRNLSALMRDRNLPAHLANVNRNPARAVYGFEADEPDPSNIVKALCHWADTGDEKQFRLILRCHPELKNAVIDGRTLLMIAVELGLWTATVVLLSIGAEKKVLDSNGDNLFHIACKKGREKVVEGLIIFLAEDVNQRNCKGETPLHCAILSGSLPCVDRLLNASTIDLNAQDSNGNTPLHVLSAMEELPTRIAMLHRMLSNVKVDQLVLNNDGLTPLQLAIISNQPKVVESMIRMKPTLLMSDGCHSLLPLHLAAAYGHASVLEVILKHFSDVSKTTKASRTALHFAVEHWDDTADQDMQRLSCIQMLVSLGVALNTRDCDGMTALHLVAQTTQGQAALPNNKVQAVLQMKKSNMRLEELASALRPQWPVAVMCFLIAQGADPQIRDRSGCVPFKLVTEPSLKSLFEQYAACRPRSCVPMSSSVTRNFDTSGVTICTFNCDDNVADIVFMPCGHRVVCATCASNTSLRRCPLCYQEIVAGKNSYGELVEIGGNLARHNCGDSDLGENVKMMDEAEIQKIAQEAVERAKKAAEEEKNEIVRELRDKLEQLELEITCAICMDQRCTIVFQCGHTACADCASPTKMKLCHICRQSIKRRTTIYT